MNSPNIVRDRLLEAMVEEGFRHPDGTANKTRFAKHLCRQNGSHPEGDQLKNWQQNVFRWTRKERPVGLSEDMARFVARALHRPDDFLLPETIYQDVTRERDELRAQVEENTRRIDVLERLLQAELDDLSSP